MTKKNSTGGNAGRNRSHNKRVVLNFVRANDPSGRAEIARSCQLSIQAVSNITEVLEEDGLLLAIGQKTGIRGKPATQYTLNPEGAFAIGIEVRPDALICAVLNLKGDCVYSEIQAFTDASPDKAIPVITKMVDSAIKSCTRKRNQLLGAGIVMPGPFGVSGLSALGGANLPNWDGIDIQTAFEKALGCPVIIENDATAAAIAERVTGKATTIDTFCFVYFGTGLGLGVIADGHALRGVFGNFGEIGHIITQNGGNQCACGNQGCLETYASRMSVKTHLEKIGIELLDEFTLVQLLNDENPDLLDWIKNAAQHLSQVISILENIFDPETIILGGAMPDAVMDTLIANLELPKGSLANRNDRTFERVLRGSSGRFTAAIGGAAMIVHKTTMPSMALFS